MKHCRNLLIISVIIVFAVMTSQCTQRSVQKDAPAEPLQEDSLQDTHGSEQKDVPAEALQEDALPKAESGAEEQDPLNAVNELYAGIASTEIPKEIAGLLSSLRKSRDDRGDMITHLQLAWLYGHYRNPSPQYLKALQELEVYLSLDPEDGGDDVMQNWHRTLKEIGRLSRENRDLREKIEHLKVQVEQLKHLDIEMEKRRQDMK